MIIGITGTNGAGKDTLADYLKKKGFTAYSLSDILREECEIQGLEKNRENLQKIGNDLRRKFGGGILAERVIKKIRENESNNFAITSIRNPQEVHFLKKQNNFLLMNIDAPINLRYQRIKSRKMAEDFVTFEVFKQQEEREKISADPNSQQLIEVAKMSDYHIDNSGTIEELYQKVDKILEDFNK